MNRTFCFAVAVTFTVPTWAGGNEELARGAASSALGLAATNMMISERFAPKCSANPAFCYIAIGAAMTAGSMLGTSGSAKGTAANYSSDDTGGWGGGGSDDQNSGGGGPSAGTIKVETDNVLNSIKKNQNISIDPTKGVISANGKEVPTSALSSGKALSDAGLLTPEQGALYDAEKKKIESSFKVVSIGVGGGGGGSTGGSSKGYAYEDPYAALYRSGLDGKPSAGKTAGLTRTLASGEVIGASTDNIFEMIRRKYQEKTDDGEFLGNEK